MIARPAVRRRARSTGSRRRTPTGAVCGQPRGRRTPSVRWHVVSRAPDQAARLGACGRRALPDEGGGTPSPGPGPPRDSSTGGPLFDVDAVEECASASSGRRADNFAVGRFVRGFRLDASRTRRLHPERSPAPGPRRGCAKQRTFAVIIESPGLGQRRSSSARLLARRAARSPRRHRESRRGEADPRRPLGVAAHAEVRDRDAADPDHDQPDCAAEAELPVLGTAAVVPSARRRA